MSSFTESDMQMNHMSHSDGKPLYGRFDSNGEWHLKQSIEFQKQVNIYMNVKIIISFDSILVLGPYHIW